MADCPIKRQGLDPSIHPSYLSTHPNPQNTQAAIHPSIHHISPPHPPPTNLPHHPRPPSRLSPACCAPPRPRPRPTGTSAAPRCGGGRAGRPACAPSCPASAASTPRVGQWVSGWFTQCVYLCIYVCRWVHQPTHTPPNPFPPHSPPKTHINTDARLVELALSVLGSLALERENKRALGLKGKGG